MHRDADFMRYAYAVEIIPTAARDGIAMASAAEACPPGAEGDALGGVACAVAPLSLAEPNTAVVEFMASAAEQIYQAFLPDAVHAFVLAAPPSRPFGPSDGRLILRSLRTAARIDGTEPAIGQYVNPIGWRLARRKAQLDELDAAWGRSYCVSSFGIAHDVTILFVLPLHVGASESYALALQKDLRRLTDVIIGKENMSHGENKIDSRISALSTVLSDIASQLDIDKVLESIVTNTRNLFGSDSAYLAQVDEESRRVQIRVTVGIRDLGYRRGSAEFGKGLAGAIVASRQIMFSSDYLADPRFIHTSDTDANMRREGMRSVLAAPLQVGNRIIGVLAVTNHYPTSFGQDDVRIIKSLADGAAIALENAQLYSHQTRLVDELRELNTRTLRQHDALKRSILIHDQLTQIVLQDQGIDAIAEQLERLINNPVAVLDTHCCRVALAGMQPTEADAVCAEIAPGLRRLTGERRPIHLTAGSRRAAGDSLLVAPIRAGTELLGYIVVFEEHHPLEAAEFQTLEQAATIFALALTRARVIEEVEFRLRGDFVHDLVSGTFDQDTIVKRASRLGHDLSSPQLVLAVARDPQEADAIEQAARRSGANEAVRNLERSVRGVLHRRSISAQTSVVDDVVVALLALSREARINPRLPEPVTRLLHADLAALLPRSSVSIGMSRVCTEPAGLGRSYREARQALRACQRMGLRSHVLAYERLGIERLLFMALERHELADFVDAVLGPIVAYDRSHGADLVSTLRCYLETGRRQRATANMLGVHVNSLSYRLRRIEEVGDLSLDDAETCLNLHVAVRMLELQGSARVRPA